MLEKLKWNSVEDRLPELKGVKDNKKSTDCLVKTKDKGYFVARLCWWGFIEDKVKWQAKYTGCGCCEEFLDVTHWAYLPKC